MLDLSKLVIETPSWGYGDSGTRFGVFAQPGRPRDVFEKLDDAAEVHRLTGTAPKVALHFPWDAVDDYDELRGAIEARGLQVGAGNGRRSSAASRMCARSSRYAGMMRRELRSPASTRRASRAR